MGTGTKRPTPMGVKVCCVDIARAEGEGEERELCLQLPLIASLSSRKATKIRTSVIGLAKQTAAHSSKAHEIQVPPLPVGQVRKDATTF